MNPKSDDDLLETFAHARRCEREDAPAWRAELLEPPAKRPRTARRWILLMVEAACVLALVVFITGGPQQEPRLSEALPPLFDAPPAELFASVEPALLSFEAPSDFLLTPHLHSTNP